MKDLCINLTKYIQDLCEENYKTLMKEIKGLNKRRDSPCSLIGRLIIVKISSQFDLYVQSQSKSLPGYFVDIKKEMP